MTQSTNSPPDQSWLPSSEKILIHTPVLDVFEQERRSSMDGRRHRFYTIRSQDWCNVIPVTEDGKIVLVRQYRVGIDAMTLEFPGGIIDHEDSTDGNSTTSRQTACSAALRELVEETGYEPLLGARCEWVGRSHANPAIFNNWVHSLVVGPVRKMRSQKLDSGEMIETVEVPIAELARLLNGSEFTSAMMLITVLFALFQSPRAGAVLTEALEPFVSAQVSAQD